MQHPSPDAGAGETEKTRKDNFGGPCVWKTFNGCRTTNMKLTGADKVRATIHQRQLLRNEHDFRSSHVNFALNCAQDSSPKNSHRTACTTQQRCHQKSYAGRHLLKIFARPLSAASFFSSGNQCSRVPVSRQTDKQTQVPKAAGIAPAGPMMKLLRPKLDQGPFFFFLLVAS